MEAFENNDVHFFSHVTNSAKMVDYAVQQLFWMLRFFGLIKDQGQGVYIPDRFSSKEMEMENTQVEASYTFLMHSTGT